MKRMTLIIAVVVTCTLAMAVHGPIVEKTAAPDSPDLFITIVGDADRIYDEGTECLLVTYDFWHGYTEIPSEIRLTGEGKGFELTSEKPVSILGEGPAQTWSLMYFDEGSEGMLFDLFLNGNNLGEFLLSACLLLDA